MAPNRGVMPNVFVGCPYGGAFDLDAFVNTLSLTPFGVFYANTSLHTRHLLDSLEAYIIAADFCIFDISTWNANVSLELGLAKGLGADYYILLNKSLSSNVPADIRGIQRIEYSRYGGFDRNQSLYPLLCEYLTRQYAWPDAVWDALGGAKRRGKFHLAMRILGHLRDNKRLTKPDIQQLSHGTYLRDPDRECVLEALEDLGLLGNLAHRNGATLKKKIFQPLPKV